jgi:hypothetical protein
MKTKLLAVLATLSMVASASAVKINNNLSINGFIDGSWTDRNEDHLTGTASNDSQDVSVDEVELNFVVNAGNVSGLVAIDTDVNNRAADDNIDVEQAHFTYTLENGLSVTFVRYGSKLGLEREDPAGLYTFSRAYGDGGVAGAAEANNYGDVDNVVFDGIAFGYTYGNFELGLSLDQSVEDNLETQGEGLNYEVSVSYTGIDNLVVNAGWRAQDGLTGDGLTLRDSDGNLVPQDQSLDTDHINVNAAYTLGKALIAFEWQEESNDRTTAGLKGDVEAAQFIVDYDFTDKIGAAFRYSTEDKDADERSGLEISKITIAPNYAITDSLGLIVEYTTADVDVAAGQASDDYDFVAAELTFTF